MYDRGLQYYANRVREAIESEESVDSDFPKLEWYKQPMSPQLGSLVENESRSSEVFSVEVVAASSPKPLEHFDFKSESEKPLLKFQEPPQYFPARTHCISYYDSENQLWINESFLNPSSDGNGSEVTLNHFSVFSARNTRVSSAVYLDERFLDPRYDFDFTNVDDTNKTFSRGRRVYKRPVGYFRKAISVLSKYENDKWLGTGDGDEVWPVAYHGTRTANALPILQAGLQVGGSTVTRANGNSFGDGIYLTPDIKIAERYAVSAPVGNFVYRVIFQVRVSPTNFREPRPNIWVAAQPDHVRPYGILLKEMPLSLP